MEWINSSDSHILEPEDLFESALGAKYPDDCPRYIDEYQGVEAKFYYTGYEYVRIDEIVEGDESEEGQALQEEMIRASKDPYERLKCLDKDGVWAEILNSTWMLYTMRAPNDDMVRDCCRVYNDWIAEHCSADPRRLYGTAMVHMQDPDWAAAELERVRKRGLKSVLINCDTRPEWPLYQDPHYDRFWAAAQDLEMPVTLHIITGNVKDLFTFHGEERKKVPGATYQLLQECTWVLSNEFIFGGIMDRFPGAQDRLLRVRGLVAALLAVPPAPDALGAGAVDGHPPAGPRDRRVPAAHLPRHGRRQRLGPVHRPRADDQHLVGIGLPARALHLPQQPEDRRRPVQATTIPS